MSNTPTDRQKTDQIIAECLVKAAHVVLGSRLEQHKSSLQQTAKKSWVHSIFCAVKYTCCNLTLKRQVCAAVQFKH